MQIVYLEDVVARLQVCDVDPLTVNVMPVGIRAANCNALCPEVCTLVPLLDSWQQKEKKCIKILKPFRPRFIQISSFNLAFNDTVS